MTDTVRRFTELAEPLRDALWRFAMRTSWDRASAEDALQEALVTAYRKFHTFSLGTDFRAWVFRILVNTIRNFNARWHRSPEVAPPGGDLDLIGALERETAYDSILEAPDRFFEGVSDPVKDAIGDLRERERMAFLLRAVEGFSYREISQFLDVPAGTVMSDIFRARAKLREVLAEHARETGFARRPSP